MDRGRFSLCVEVIFVRRLDRKISRSRRVLTQALTAGAARLRLNCACDFE